MKIRQSLNVQKADNGIIMQCNTVQWKVNDYIDLHNFDIV